MALCRSSKPVEWEKETLRLATNFELRSRIYWCVQGFPFWRRSFSRIILTDVLFSTRFFLGSRLLANLLRWQFASKVSTLVRRKTGIGWRTQVGDKEQRVLARVQLVESIIKLGNSL